MFLAVSLCSALYPYFFLTLSCCTLLVFKSISVLFPSPVFFCYSILIPFSDNPASYKSFLLSLSWSLSLSVSLCLSFFLSLSLFLCSFCFFLHLYPALCPFFIFCHSVHLLVPIFSSFLCPAACPIVNCCIPCPAGCPLTTPPTPPAPPCCLSSFLDLFALPLLETCSFSFSASLSCPAYLLSVLKPFLLFPFFGFSLHLYVPSLSLSSHPIPARNSSFSFCSYSPASIIFLPLFLSPAPHLYFFMLHTSVLLCVTVFLFSASLSASLSLSFCSLFFLPL